MEETLKKTKLDSVVEEITGEYKGCHCPFVRECVCNTNEERALVYSDRNFHRCCNTNFSDNRCPNKFWGLCLNIAPKYGLREGHPFNCRNCDPLFLINTMYHIIIIIIVIIFIIVIKYIVGKN